MAFTTRKVDTGHFFSYKPDPMSNFLRHTLKSIIQYLFFLRAYEVLEASEAAKKKEPQLHHFWGKIKVRSNFI